MSSVIPKRYFFLASGDQNHDEEATIESRKLGPVAKDLTLGDENDEIGDNESNTQSDEHHEDPATESIPLQAIAKDLTGNEDSHDSITKAVSDENHDEEDNAIESFPLQSVAKMTDEK